MSPTRGSHAEVAERCVVLFTYNVQSSLHGDHECVRQNSPSVRSVDTGTPLHPGHFGLTD